MANSDMNLDQVLQTFILEARELLEDMEAALLRVAGEDDPKESIAAIFRAAHTMREAQNARTGACARGVDS